MQSCNDDDRGSSWWRDYCGCLVLALNTITEDYAEISDLNATNEVADDGERIVMQVVSLARLKYSVSCYFSDDQKDSRENFKQLGRGI